MVLKLYSSTSTVLEYYITCVNHAQLLTISLDFELCSHTQFKTYETFSENAVPLHYNIHQTSGLGVNLLVSVT